MAGGGGGGDLYAVLGLAGNPHASGDEIRRAYRRQAVQWHPVSARRPGGGRRGREHRD